MNTPCDSHKEHVSRIVRSEQDVQTLFSKVQIVLDKLDALSGKVMIIVGIGVCLQFAASMGVFDPIKEVLRTVDVIDVVVSMYP